LYEEGDFLIFPHYKGMDNQKALRRKNKMLWKEAKMYGIANLLIIDM